MTNGVQERSVCCINGGRHKNRQRGCLFFVGMNPRFRDYSADSGAKSAVGAASSTWIADWSSAATC